MSHDSYEEPGGSLRLATAVASRDGGLLAYDSGEVYEPGGRVPASRLFDDDDLTERPVKTCVDALADLTRRSSRTQALTTASRKAGERLSARVLNACTVVVASTVKPA